MTTTPATPTDVTATTAPGASVHIGGAASSHVAPPGRSAALRSELEAIVTRLPEAGQRRAALLEVMLRQRRIVGGVWFDLGHEQPQAVLTRLPGPALDRTTLRAWITSVAQGLDRQGGIAEFPCPQIRNLTALAISVRQEKSTEAVVLLAANTGTKPIQDEWLALQQLAMVWEGAALQRRVRASEDRTRLAAALLDLTGRIQTADSVREACQELVRSLQEHFGCGLVAVGLRPHGSQVAKLIATSDGVDPDPHGVQVQRLEAALAECVVAEQVLHCPDADRAGGAPTLAHKRLAGVLGAESAVSAPLRSRQQEVIGALLCVGGAAKLLPETTRDFLSAASEPIGSALMSVQRHEGGRLLRLGRAIASGASRSRLVAIVLALAAIGGVLSIPVPYRISAGCRLEPQERRLSPAPFDGLLETTHVAPGDVVATGQLLATMDGREVEWELAGVIADQQRAAKERDTYLASHEVARSLMSGLEVERLAARETLLRDRLARLKVCSPIDGIVLSGSLDRRENVPVTVGQSLYEIAPLAELRLEVEVPADEVSHIREGMPIEIRMHGLASEVRSGVIDRIRPGSEVRDGRNVFVAEVSIDNRTGDLRPGMKGSVRVIGDSHPLGWNLFHRPWDYLLRRFF